MPESSRRWWRERGATLSGGQRRRIAIARAVVRDTPILIPRRADVRLDAASEQYVTEALERLMKGRTSIVIAAPSQHHPERRRDFRGEGRGGRRARTIDELLAKGGVFAGLHAIQRANGPAHRRGAPFLILNLNSHLTSERGVHVAGFQARAEAGAQIVHVFRDVGPPCGSRPG